MKSIIIKGAKEGNLKNISIEIPREKLVVITGLSGSGKSTLAIDTLYQECQRQYLEAIGYQGIHKPKVEYINNISPAVRITQNEYNRNPRSSLGTVTNIYTDLRMIYEKLHKRICPNCHCEIISSECREEVEKTGDDFKVYMYCSNCGYKMDKLTRTYFSYNTREGACKCCEGLGKVMKINEEAVIHQALSLESGAVDFWEHRYKDYQIEILYKAFNHYSVPIEKDTPISHLNQGQKSILLYGTDSNEVMSLFPEIKPPSKVSEGRFEGVYATLWRRISEKEGDSRLTELYFETEACTECQGERLNQLSRSVTVLGTRLPELTMLTLDELQHWLLRLQAYAAGTDKVLAESYLRDLNTKVHRIIKAGLGYLSLDRQTMTLSGGEAQRVKLAAALDSVMTGIIYIMDEPTLGLHPKDTSGVIRILKELRDMGNTVIVIEHDADVIKEADYIIDMGPGAGTFGGEIIGKGTLKELMKQSSSVTGKYLKELGAVRTSSTEAHLRKGTGDFISIKNASLHNLKNISVKLPMGCLISITGVSGSGKSTLIFDVLAKEGAKAISNVVSGTEAFESIITVEQRSLTRMKRSNVATYSGVYTEIRNIFGRLKESKEKGITSSHFSFNNREGRCENCEGLGYVTSNMLFFQDLEVTCPVCNGSRFSDEVLAVKYKGHSIKDILDMSVEEALAIFEDYPKIVKILSLLKKSGLGYLVLGQTLTTLSGGEGQRLKLARELTGNWGSRNLYLIDEPTAGLHAVDVENFIVMLNSIVESGSSVVVVEHNVQVIKSSDWIVDLGPEGGINGGRIIAEGTPEDLKRNSESVTGKYI